MFNCPAVVPLITVVAFIFVSLQTSQHLHHAAVSDFYDNLILLSIFASGCCYQHAPPPPQAQSVSVLYLSLQHCSGSGNCNEHARPQMQPVDGAK